MPRMARIVVSGYPRHVVQRGHNRQVMFADVLDYTRYLATLRGYKVEYRVKVWAWCLMTNHVHLILVPDDREGLGQLLKRRAGRQTRHHNKLECRSGTLWEGRYKSSLVQQAFYLRACCRYLELNPVRAQMVATQEA
jgi:putative transposase